MPRYEFHCPIGCHVERVLTLRQHGQVQTCDEHGYVMEQIISAPILVVAQPECHYTSPIDDRPITSWAERRNDLARSNCQPYDPEMKTDAARFRAEKQAAVDLAIDATVEESVEKMSTKQRAQLWSEVREQGVGMETLRSTP